MKTLDLFADTPRLTQSIPFDPTRAAGLAQLEAFVARMGDHYASKRNYDLGAQDRSTASSLSPWIRHRLITEEEVLTRALARHSPSAAGKFIQEIFWRGYFKGWMEQHPSVWATYERDLVELQQTLEADPALKRDYSDAVEGRSGIACFDHWVRELVQTGYLHNHARMWVASIWIFTLRLPWQLGAAFFMRHLLDGDPASNTISWRWVGGLHTKGKTYLARASNIEKYTEGRFNPMDQLAGIAVALEERDAHPLRPLPIPTAKFQATALHLITEEDCHPTHLLTQSDAPILGLLAGTDAYSEQVQSFKKTALQNATMQIEHNDDWAARILQAAQDAGTRDVITSYIPVGPIAAQIERAKPLLAREGITLHQHMRSYDRLTWPHASKGFFKLKKQIPKILADLDLKPLV